MSGYILWCLSRHAWEFLGRVTIRIGFLGSPAQAWLIKSDRETKASLDHKIMSYGKQKPCAARAFCVDSERVIGFSATIQNRDLDA